MRGLQGFMAKSVTPVTDLLRDEELNCSQLVTPLMRDRMFIVESLVRRRAALSACLVAALACGDDTGTEPTEVTLGESTFVVLVNPIVNDDNEAPVPTPGSAESGVNVSVAGGLSGSTNASGVVVLSPVEPVAQTLSVGGNDVTVSIADKDLREVVIAFDGGSAIVMANVRYAFGGQVVEITPSMSLPEVNSALSQNNTIVLFRAALGNAGMAPIAAPAGGC